MMFMMITNKNKIILITKVLLDIIQYTILDRLLIIDGLFDSVI